MKRIFALLLVLSIFGSPTVAVADADDDKKITICHHNEGDKVYNEITVSERSVFNKDGTRKLSGHGGHKGDLIPAPTGGCPKEEAPTSTPTTVATSTQPPVVSAPTSTPLVLHVPAPTTVAVVPASVSQAVQRATPTPTPGRVRKDDDGKGKNHETKDTPQPPCQRSKAVARALQAEADRLGTYVDWETCLLIPAVSTVEPERTPISTDTPNDAGSVPPTDEPKATPAADTVSIEDTTTTSSPVPPVPTMETSEPKVPFDGVRENVAAPAQIRYTP